MEYHALRHFLQPRLLPRLDNNRQFCLFVCLSACMLPHFAQFTDKMDPKYIIPSEASGFHNDAHPKKNMLAILDFEKKANNSFFSCFSAS